MYFRDKTDAALTVLSELLEEFLDLGGRPQAGARTQCILQLGDEDPRLAELVRRGNQIWYEKIARSSSLRRGLPPDRGAAMFVAYMLGSMMDELVRKLFIYPDPGFHTLLRQLDADDDAVADAASVIFLHVLNPGAAVPPGLPRAARQIADWLIDRAGTPKKDRAAKKPRTVSR